MKHLALSSAICIALAGNIAYAEEDIITTKEALNNIKWEVGLVAAGALYLGLDSWDWGSSSSFKFNDEGWFGLDTGSAGADKLGHMYTSYVINEFLNKRLNNKTDQKIAAARKSALFSSAIMFGVEIFDGYSDDHGFSYEDLIMNTAGIGVSYLKNTIPGLDEKIDLRIEYNPTEENNDHPVTNYSAYTYIAALKLGGFTQFKATPLKYVELQLGYHTEGFRFIDRAEFPEARTELQFGIGINISETLKPLDRNGDNPLVQSMRTFSNYYRLPYTSVSTIIDERVR